MRWHRIAQSYCNLAQHRWDRHRQPSLRMQHCARSIMSNQITSRPVATKGTARHWTSRRLIADICQSVCLSVYMSTCLSGKSAEKRQDLQYRRLLLLVETLLGLLTPDGCLGGLSDEPLRRNAYRKRGRRGCQRWEVQRRSGAIYQTSKVSNALWVGVKDEKEKEWREGET